MVGRFLSLFLCLYFFISLNFAGAQPRYRIEHFTAENGLPQNSVKNISVGQYGYIWLATEEGLVRYDGRNFVVFDRQRLKTSSDRIIGIQPAKRNTAGLNRPFSSAAADVAIANTASNEGIRIAKGVAVYDSTLFRRLYKRMQALQEPGRHLYVIKGIPDYWGNSQINGDRFLFNPGMEEGAFYIVDKAKIVSYQNWKKKYEIAYPASRFSDYFCNNGAIYQLSGPSKVVRISPAGANEFTISGDSLPSTGRKRTQEKLYWNTNTDQAFLYIGNSLYYLRPRGDGGFERKLLTTQLDLSTNHIGVVFYDLIHEKIYLGSSTRGLFVLSKQRFTVVNPEGENNEQIFYAQLPFGSNLVLTPTGLVLGKQTTGGEKYQKSRALLARLNPSDKRVILRDRDGQIWVKNGPALYRLNPDATRLTASWNFSNEIKAIRQAGGKQIYVGVINEGIYSVDPLAPLVKAVPVGDQMPKSITFLESAPDGTLIIGCIDGLYTRDAKTGLFGLVPGTKGLYIKSIHPTKGGKFWITAKEKGLMFLDGKTISAFPLDNARNLTSAHCVVEDGLGFLWIPTNRGLFRFAVSDLMRYLRESSRLAKNIEAPPPAGSTREPVYQYFTAKDGFLSNEFNGSCQPCGVRHSNGEISLPTLEGLVWFNPKDFLRTTVDAPVLLDGVTVKDQAVELANDTVRLPIDPETIEFRFSTPFFASRNSLNLSYALMREDADISSASWQTFEGKNLNVRYSVLPSGVYTLIVRRLSGRPGGGYLTTRILVIVPECWYETYWAKAMIVLILLAITYTAVSTHNSRKLRRVRMEKVSLERTVIARTNSLETALQDLENAKREVDHQVATMSRMLASMTHDVQSPLNYITLVSAEITDMVHEREYDKIPEVASMIGTTSQHTGRMLHDLLNYVKTQLYGSRIQNQKIYLQQLVESKLELFQSAIIQKEIEVSDRIPPAIQVCSDYQLLSIVVHNIIDNAVKYTNGGVVEFSIHEAENGLGLTISNSGSAMPVEKMDFINMPYDKNKAVQSTTRGAEMGLLIIKEIAELIGIEIRVTQTSRVNFNLIFSTGKDHRSRSCER